MFNAMAPKWKLLGTALLLLAPIWITAWLPLVDLNNHMARCWMLLNYQADAFYQHFYTPVLGPLPYLVLDQSLILLMRVVSPDVAAKILASLVILVQCLGCFWISRQFRTMSWVTFAVMFFGLNSMFYMGFLSNAVSVGFAFWVFALWATPKERWTWMHFAASILLGICVYYSHLVGCFCVGLGAGVFALEEWWRERKLNLWLGRFFVAALPAMVIYPFAPKFGKVGAQIIWGGLERKTWAGLSPLLGYNYTIDAIVVAGFVVALGFMVWKEVESVQVPLLLSGLAFGVCFLTFPWLLLSGTDADTRLTIPAYTLVLLSLRLRDPFAWTRWRVLFVAVMLLKLGSLAWYWPRMGNLAEEQAQLMRHIEGRSSMMPMIWSPADRAEAKQERFLIGFAPAAVHLRNAVVPTVFAVPGQHSIAVKKPFPNLSERSDALLHLGGNLLNQMEPLIDLNYLLEQYDYLYTYRAPEDLVRRLEQQSARSWSAGKGRLFLSPKAHQSRSISTIQP
jgi:hypothetical protein